MPSGRAGFEHAPWTRRPHVLCRPQSCDQEPELRAPSLRVASEGAGSDGEQMLAILNPLFNSLRQLFPIPKVGGIRIKFIPELNTHIHTRTPATVCRQNLLAFRQAAPPRPGTRLCLRLTSPITAQQLAVGPVASVPHGARLPRLPGPLPSESRCQLGIPSDFSPDPQTRRGSVSAPELASPPGSPSRGRPSSLHLPLTAESRLCLLFLLSALRGQDSLSMALANSFAPPLLLLHWSEPPSPPAGTLVPASSLGSQPLSSTPTGCLSSAARGVPPRAPTGLCWILCCFKSFGTIDLSVMVGGVWACAGHHGHPHVPVEHSKCGKCE